MKIPSLLLLFAFGLANSTFAQTAVRPVEPSPPIEKVQGYVAHMDLTNVQQDELYVTVDVPPVEDDEVLYHFPKIVPGTYSISDFGRFITDFKAFDAEGHELDVKKEGLNSWRISNATKMTKLSYWVEDTYDTDKDNPIFEPAGTNISEGNNFILNMFGFVGYLSGKEGLPYRIRVTKPEGFYGASALKSHSAAEGKIDEWDAVDYHTLADCPIMYCMPDTTTMMVGGAEVIVSVYSPKGKVTSADIMEYVKPVLLAAKDYLGGTLPCKRYAFLFYFMNGQSLSGGMGALEHMTSSVYTLPEMNPLFLKQTIKDIVAHEFLHIVTPLNIHSEEIGAFDFADPLMSQHLWLYEGVTEYSAHHVQVTQGLIKQETFLNIMRDKMRAASRFNDTVPFTKMSEFVLETYEPEYGNVYQKGALIGMCLDIKLRHYSKGAYGLPNLMQDLSKKYGKSVSFKDEELFEVIAQLSDPGIRDFFKEYVEGPKPLPFEEVLGLAGLDFQYKFEGNLLNDGGVMWRVNPATGNMHVVTVDKINSFGAAIGLKEGDELLEIQGKTITPQNFGQILQELGAKTKKGKKVKFKIARPMNDGSNLVLDVKAPAKIDKVKERYYITKKFNPSDEQKNVYETWLGRTW